MSLLSELGFHVELNAKDKKSNLVKRLFPTNTSDDVIVDENGNSLTDTLPIVKKGGTTPTGSLDVNEIEEVTIEDETLISRLTTNVVESFEDVEKKTP